MTAKPYAPTTWGDEPIFTDKLNQMSNNDQWLFENNAKMYFSAYGVKKTSGLKILAGIIRVPPGGQRRNATFYFGTFFSQGCKPVVTTGLQPYGANVSYSLTIKGLGAQFASIDNRGFLAQVYTSHTSDPHSCDIHVVAVGW